MTFLKLVSIPLFASVLRNPGLRSQPTRDTLKKRPNNIFLFILHAKKDNLMLLNQFKAFSINLTAKDVNGMTLFDGKLAKIHVVRL